MRKLCIPELKGFLEHDRGRLTGNLQRRVFMACGGKHFTAYDQELQEHAVANATNSFTVDGKISIPLPLSLQSIKSLFDFAEKQMCDLVTVRASAVSSAKAEIIEEHDDHLVLRLSALIRPK